jgi:hypothetical protein
MRWGEGAGSLPAAETLTHYDTSSVVDPDETKFGPAQTQYGTRSRISIVDPPVCLSSPVWPLWDDLENP